MDKSMRIRMQTILFLTIAIVLSVELYAEFMQLPKIILVAKPLLNVLILIYYWLRSEKRSAALTFSLVAAFATSILFITDNSSYVLFGVILFAFHRIALIYFLSKLLEPIYYFAVVIASIPVVIIFLYLLSISANLDTATIVALIVNSVLLALFVGIILANYMLKDENNNSWLLISALMFIALQLIVYIEKYYLVEFSPKILRPTAVLFLSLALLSLIKGVLTQEKLNRNTST